MALPTYMEAASIHNVGAQAEKNTFETLGDAAESVMKFTGLSIASGVNEVYNIVPTVGNWFGADMQRSNLEDRLLEYDTDLLKYYEDHKQGVDIAGFVLGSFAPGLGGMKVLNAGQAAARTAIQAGRFGETTASALGLLLPSREKYLSAAIRQLDEAGSVFKLTEANTLRAIGSGFYEQSLNAFAWETAVAATMNQSPVLDQMSLSDLMYNVAIGTVLGGGIGGIFSGVGAAWQVKKGFANVSAELAPFATRAAPSDALNPLEKALFTKARIESMPEVPADFRLAERATAARTQSIDSMWVDIRSNLSKFTRGDEDTAQILFEHFKTASSEDAFSLYLHAKTAGRLGSTTHLEAELAQLSKRAQKEGLWNLKPEEAQKLLNTETSVLRTWGEASGSKLDEAPQIRSLTDKYSKLSAKEDGVYGNGKLLYSHSNNPHKPFNIANADHYEVESRYIWAEHLPAWKATDDVMVHTNDIPLLEKALRDGVENIKVIPEDGSIFKASTVAKGELEDFLIAQKRRLQNELAQARTNPSPEVMAEKLMAWFGVNINISDSKTFLGRWMQKTEQGLKWESIELSRAALSQRNLMKIVKTLEHERGHSMFQAMMRGLSSNFKEMAPYMRKGLPTDYVDPQFAAVLDSLIPELKTLSKRIRPSHWNQAKWDMGAREYLTQAHELMADSFSYFAQHPEQLDKFPQFKAYAGHLIKPIPAEVRNMLQTRAALPTQDEIAKIINVRTGWMDGSAVTPKGHLARTEYRADYLNKMQQAGTRAGEQVADPLMLPQHIKMIVDTTPMQGMNGYVLDGMTYLAQKEKLFKVEARQTVTSNLGMAASDLPEISARQLSAGPSEGPGFATFANSNYGTGGSVFSYIGQRTHALIKQAKDATIERLNPVLNRLGNNQKAAIEWSVINEKVRSSPYRYILDLEQGALVAKISPEDMAKAVAAGDELAVIPIKEADTLAVVQNHMQLNGARAQGLAKIRNAEGTFFKRDPNEFYPIPRNPKDTPHFAFVVDDSITGVGHSQMIYAATEQELEVLKQGVRQQRPDLKILTKAESEAYHKAYGQFSFERTINERLFDNSQVRSGTSASFLPKTDPAKIVQETLDWHLARDATYVRENISHLYNKEFNVLREAGESLTQSAKSKFGYVSPLARAESSVSNPPNDLVKMALDISKVDEYPTWNLQKKLDEKISAVWTKFSDSFRKAKSPEELEQIGKDLKDAGYGGVLHVTDKLYEASNRTIERGALASFVNKANALIATFALRLDPLNALNNAIGANVLLNTELRSLLGNIAKGNEEAAGELGKLAFIQAPGTGRVILSHQKLMANAISNYHSRPDLRQWAKQHGFVSSISDQYDQSLDIMATTISNGRIADAFQKLKGIADKGEIWTGNKLAEEFNRFISADIMRQITEIGVKHGVIKSEKEALSYINTFVNRTQGNYLASQRPLMFQGPVGQAIGLFQTYQFNLIQQLLRYVGEGEAKSALAMMGLQGSIYGMQGLPAFNAINTHILGNAPGNKEHTDIYKAVYSGVGKDAGDWLLYGGASNVLGLIHPDLKNNLYTRGDINPRHLFVVPTSPDQLPIYVATSRVLKNMMDMGSNIVKGGAVGESFLRAIEHNGLSRPLTGLALTAEAMYSGKGVRPTSNTGNILMTQDLASLASLTRLAGGKPLDESLVQDAMFRFTAYRAADKARRDSLGEAVKMKVLSGAELSDDDVTGFAEAYHRAGGKQTEFAQFMARQYRNTTAPQSEILREKLSSPYSKHLQELMGGNKFKTDVELSPE